MNENRDTDLQLSTTNELATFSAKTIYSAYDRNHFGFGRVNWIINHSPKNGM